MAFQVVDLNSAPFSGTGWIQAGATVLGSGVHHLRAFGLALGGDAEVRLVDPSDSSVAATVTLTQTSYELSAASPTFNVSSERRYNVQIRSTAATGSGTISWVGIDQPGGGGALGQTVETSLYMPGFSSSGEEDISKYLNRAFILLHLNWVAEQCLIQHGFSAEGRVHNQALVWEHITTKNMPAFCIVWAPNQQAGTEYATFRDEFAQFAVMIHVANSDPVDKLVLTTTLYSSFMEKIRLDTTAGGWAIHLEKSDGLLSDEAVFLTRGDAAVAALATFTLRAQWADNMWDARTMKLLSASLGSSFAQVLDTGGVPENIEGSWTLNQTNYFQIGSTNEMTYTNDRSYNFRFNAILCVSCPSAVQLTVDITVGGLALTDGQGITVVDLPAGQIVAVPLMAILPLQRDSTIRVRLTSDLAETITVQNGLMTVDAVSPF